MVEVAAVVQIFVRSFLLLIPISVAALACRRLWLSRSENAWLYAGMTLLGTVAAVGLVPWAIGFGSVSATIVFLALLSPVFWLGTVLLCDDPASSSAYDEVEEVVELPVFQSRKAKPGPLVLEGADWPDMPKAQFNRAFRADTIEAKIHEGEAEKALPVISKNTRALISIVRDMRANPNSESRRPKLLPPPKNRASLSEMPFIR